MKAKKLVLAVVVVFLGFWMFTDPNGLAQAFRSGGAQVWELRHAAVPGADPVLRRAHLSP